LTINGGYEAEKCAASMTLQKKHMTFRQKKNF